MNREYQKWFSPRLRREMELLVFGHSGLPVVVFPTSAGRFYEFEDRGMVAALADKIEAGRLHLFCLDSVDAESWYNREVPAGARIARHLEYEGYILGEVLPFARTRNAAPQFHALGLSFGGYHAVNIALRHPDLFSGFLSLSGVFRLESFLGGYCDEDCYLNLPAYYLPHLDDPWYLDRFRQGRYVLATGWDDHCLDENRNLDRILTEKGIPHQLFIWDAVNAHDWPTWQRMVREYL